MDPNIRKRLDELHAESAGAAPPPVGGTAAPAPAGAHATPLARAQGRLQGKATARERELRRLYAGGADYGGREGWVDLMRRAGR